MFNCNRYTVQTWRKSTELVSSQSSFLWRMSRILALQDCQYIRALFTLLLSPFYSLLLIGSSIRLWFSHSSLLSWILSRTQNIFISSLKLQSGMWSSEAHHSVSSRNFISIIYMWLSLIVQRSCGSLPYSGTETATNLVGQVGFRF